MKTPRNDNPYVIVVGPLIADHYYLGRATRLDQTAAVPIVDVAQKHTFAGVGGGANAARCITRLAMPTALITAVGDDSAGRAFRARKAEPMMRTYVHQVKGYQTAQKHRVYSDGHLVSRLDIDERPKKNVEDYVVDMFRSCVSDNGNVAAILISDYDKGICTERTLDVVMKYARERSVPVVVDPVPAHMPWYAGATIITPNEYEACAATGLSNVMEAGKVICEELDIERCVITCGAEGLLITDKKEANKRVPALPTIAVDSCGAGDVVAAALTYAAAVDMSPDAAAQFAVTAGAIAVESGGTTQVPLYSIHRRLAATYGSSQKLVELSFAKLLRASASNSGARFGIANGVFDLLHPGHVSMLQQAKQACEFLLVLVNTDESAARIKREPRQNQRIRMAQLANLPVVDAVMPFETDTPTPIIEQLLPDVLVKGPELKGKEDQIPGHDVVINNGGSVITTELEYDIHASQFIEQETKEPAEQKDTTQTKTGSSSRRAAHTAN